MMIAIEDILKMDDAHRQTVIVPEWNGAELLVVSMTALERSEIEKRWSRKDAGSDPAAFRADVLERCLKKPDGSPFGTTEQIRGLLAKNANAVERIFEAACAVSGFGKQDIKELEKN